MTGLVTGLDALTDIMSTSTATPYHRMALPNPC